MMLRTKQLGTLSQCARSFILSGSRSTTADGTTCTCSEDETCISKRQSKSTDILFAQKTSVLASKSAERAETPLSSGVIGTVGYPKSESCVFPASVPNVLSAPTSSLRSDGVDSVNGDAHAASKNFQSSSKLVSERFVKAGIATVSLLSDLMNYKIPTFDGSGVLHTPQKCMVDSTKPISNIRSSNGKSHKRVVVSKVQTKHSVDTAGGSNSTDRNHVPKGKSDSMRSLQHVSSTAPGASVGTASLPLDTQGQRQPIPQRAQSQSYRIFQNSRSSGQIQNSRSSGQIAEGKVGTPTPQSIRYVDKEQQPMRFMRTQAGAATRASPSANGRTVERLYHTLQQLKWGPAAEEALGSLTFKIDAYQANQVLKQLQDHSVALGFFYWLKRRAGFKHDEHSYTTMVGILGRARQFVAIDRLLEEMVRDGCQPNVVTYNRLIHSYGRANYMDEAMNVFYQMQEAGCNPDRVTYCTLIDIHAKAGFLDIAMDLYRRMQEAGLSPDTFTYGVIINCLGKAGHLSSAYKLFCEMIAQGCVPNLVTYNIMIALQAKARNYSSALKLYREMQTAGFHPDKVTYSIVMEVLGHCNHLEEAEAVFLEMKREDWTPDEPVYGLLVDMWGKSGNVNKARGWYQSMLDAGLRPNVPTCNSLLSAFLKAHRFYDAHCVLESMLRLGLHPSLQTYTLLLSCCTDTMSHGDMGLCCELMAFTGHPAHTFLLSMPAAGPDGQNVREHAGNFLDLMHSEDRESKRGLVDAVIDFLHKSGLKEEAGSVWEVAARRNVYPDAVREKRSSYWLINLHVMSDGTAVTALSRTLAWFRREMLTSGIGPHRIDIVTGWGRRSRVTGSSLVRQSVKELLHLFRFPFSGNGNSGCFVGCGEPLSRWLLQSYVERMHLL